uniref:Protoporphyrinogen oxidase n=1 Tax=Rhizophora mucronata TaxID=61149 RepID=A0A2P2L3T6_RHIMU
MVSVLMWNHNTSLELGLKKKNRYSRICLIYPQLTLLFHFYILAHGNTPCSRINNQATIMNPFPVYSHPKKTPSRKLHDQLLCIQRLLLCQRPIHLCGYLHRRIQEGFPPISRWLLALNHSSGNTREMLYSSRNDSQIWALLQLLTTALDQKLQSVPEHP